jgi:hypothetical protein
MKEPQTAIEDTKLTLGFMQPFSVRRPRESRRATRAAHVPISFRILPVLFVTKAKPCAQDFGARESGVCFPKSDPENDVIERSPLPISATYFLDLRAR